MNAVLERQIPASTARPFDEVIVVDARTLRICHVSDGALARLGYSLDELEGVDVSMIGPDYPLELLSSPTDGTATAYRSIKLEHRQKDGGHYEVASRVHLRGANASASFLILANRLPALAA